MDEENMMGLNISFLTTCESWNMNVNCQEWYNTISNDKVEKLHFGMQDEEYLNSSKQNMCWAPCLTLKYSLGDLNFKRNLEEQLKNEKKPWQTTM